MRRAVYALTRIPVRIYYRRWALGGEIPASGPVIVVSNHPNGLVDPVLVASRAPRLLRFLAKEPLFRIPVLGWIVRGMGCLPVYRSADGADTGQNEETFRAVTDALAAGDAVCLFPEGVTHSEPALQRLKTGAARMALKAEDQHGFGLGVRIVPVGLVYGCKARFRSKVATWVGEPVSAADLETAYAADPRAAVRTLTERVAEGLRSVTVNLDRWDDLPLLELVERIWRPHQGRRVARLRALASGLSELRRRDARRVDALERRVSSFADTLRRLRISPEDLELRYRPGEVARFVVRNLAQLGLGFPLAVLGGLIWAVPFLAVRAVVASSKAPEDIQATVKLVAATLLYPVWLAVGAVVALSTLETPLALVATAAAPLLGWIGLRWAETQTAALEDAAVFVRLGAASTLKRRLRARRDQLVREIEALARELA